MTKIKICGLRREQDIRYANELMPDYIGFVFLKGKMRYVTFEEAAHLRSLLDPAIPAVGVAGIWWSVPIGWFLADAVGLGYYWWKRRTLFEMR